MLLVRPVDRVVLVLEARARVPTAELAAVGHIYDVIRRFDGLNVGRDTVLQEQGFQGLYADFVFGLFTGELVFQAEELVLEELVLVP